MKRFEIDLPNYPIEYEGIELIARPNSSYDPEKCVEQFARFFMDLYRQLPHSVVEKLKRDQRIDSLRKALEKSVW